ncbi:MAG TPA: hypothetical protein VG318_15160 [Actinomycetota bacterium]|nr:hypothetical protein [Actinomycetota bacterium]
MDEEEREALEMTKEQLLAAAVNGAPADVAKADRAPKGRSAAVREMNPGKKLGQKPRPVPSSQRENTRYNSVTGV